MVSEIVLEKIIAQIEIYAGKQHGGLAVLQDWYDQHYLVGKDTQCECCLQNIEKQGHHENCPIVRRYMGLFKQ